MKVPSLTVFETTNDVKVELPCFFEKLWQDKPDVNGQVRGSYSLGKRFFEYLEAKLWFGEALCFADTLGQRLRGAERGGILDLLRPLEPSAEVPDKTPVKRAQTPLAVFDSIESAFEGLIEARNNMPRRIMDGRNPAAEPSGWSPR